MSEQTERETPNGARVTLRAERRLPGPTTPAGYVLPLSVRPLTSREQAATAAETTLTRAIRRAQSLARTDTPSKGQVKRHHATRTAPRLRDTDADTLTWVTDADGNRTLAAGAHPDLVGWQEPNPRVPAQTKGAKRARAARAKQAARSAMDKEFAAIYAAKMARKGNARKITANASGYRMER